MFRTVSRFRLPAILAACCWLPAFAAAGASQAAEPRSWRIAAELAAEEAKQAAAADEKYVYVVTNDRVAKYDRATKLPPAVSEPKLKHLNSAFLWGGDVYLAHSNYPQQPERSEIYRLDVDTMRLEKFHDFGNFGGSLTWCVRRGDQWWCNFALYGEANRRTFLVRFDLDWNETGRWTYPPPVFSRIGKASFSGGIWYGESLLTTDHDHGRLYRFQVPESGDVLELLGEEPAPLTGQGFAVDPATGGLVGIDRARRKVLFLIPSAVP